jgi:hypothetical protein
MQAKDDKKLDLCQGEPDYLSWLLKSKKGLFTWKEKNLFEIT